MVEQQEFSLKQGTVTVKQVADLLCCALDVGYGGSYYWCSIAKLVAPTAWTFDYDTDGLLLPHGEHYGFEYPLSPNGALLIVDELDDDDGVLTLDWAALQKGLDLLAEKYPQRLASIFEENTDAEDGDVFLQLCLFGDIVYG